MSSVLLVVAASVGEAAATSATWGGLADHQGFVVVAVAAAFAFPALIAGLYALLYRASRALGPMVSTLACIVAAAALVAYLQSNTIEQLAAELSRWL